MVGVPPWLRFGFGLKGLDVHRRQSALTVAMMLPLGVEIVFDALPGCAAGGTGEIAACEEPRRLLQTEALPEPFAHLPFHLTRTRGQRLGWSQANEDSAFLRAAIALENVDAERLNKPMKGRLVEACQIWKWLAAMGSPVQVGVITVGELEFLEMVVADLHGGHHGRRWVEAIRKAVGLQVAVNRTNPGSRPGALGRRGRDAK